MSSTINASTASGGGVVTTADASGILQLQTAGTTALTIDASQNVGIGTSSPAQKLTVSATTATQGIVSTTTGNAAYLVLQNSADSSNAYVYATGKELRLSQADTSASSIVTISTQNTERMRIDSSGRLLIAATSLINNVDTAPLQVSGGAVTPIALRGGTNGYQIAFYNSAGTAVIGSVTGATGSTTAYNTASDQRLKENIVDAPSALASVNAIKVRSFDWKSDGTHVNYGYIAQELLKVAPEAVAVPSNEDEMMGVDFGKLTPRLVKSIQELKAIIDTQNARIEALEAKI